MPIASPPQADGRTSSGHTFGGDWWWLIAGVVSAAVGIGLYQSLLSVVSPQVANLAGDCGMIFSIMTIAQRRAGRRWPTALGIGALAAVLLVVIRVVTNSLTGDGTARGGGTGGSRGLGFVLLLVALSAAIAVGQRMGSGSRGERSGGRS